MSQRDLYPDASPRVLILDSPVTGQEISKNIFIFRLDLPFLLDVDPARSPSLTNLAEFV